MDLRLSDEKEKILHEEYDITLTHDMRKELTEMGGLMEPLLKVAVEQTRETTAAETEKKSKLEDIRSLMETMKWTAQQAMDALQVPSDKQIEYLTLI